MKSIISSKILLTVLGLILVSCIQDPSSRTGKGLIKDFTIEGDEPQTTATPTPVATTASETRPTDQIFPNKDICICRTKKVENINRCDAFCSKATAEVSTLFGSVTLGPEVELNERFGNLYNWCNATINDGQTRPSCVLEVNDGNGASNLQADLIIQQNSNSFQIAADGLEFNKPYVVKIKEVTSGATSTAFQVLRIDSRVDPSLERGPIQMIPISMYTCMNNWGQLVNGENHFYDQARTHFLYPPNNRPSPLRAYGNQFPTIYCHDIQKNGVDDDMLYPRLELISGHFHAWDPHDVRLQDRNNDTVLDIHKEMVTRLKQEHNYEVKVEDFKVFFEFQWPNGPTESGSNNTTTPTLGYFLTAWTDNSGKAYCPGQDQYHGSNPVFKLLKEYIGVDTEGIYVAKKQDTVLNGPNGKVEKAPDDIILIREGLLKKIWFYTKDDGLTYRPDDTTAMKETLMFYWPADAANPYVKKSHQETYIIRHLSELTSSTASKEPDKRIGCVPKLNTD